MSNLDLKAEAILKEASTYRDVLSFDTDFPIYVFPDRIKTIIRETNSCLNFPIDYIATSLCFAVSTAIGNTYSAKIKVGWSERAILYIALVGRPGMNKSHPLSFAMQPLFEYDSKQAILFKKELKEYENLMLLSKKEREEQGIYELPEEPTIKKFIVSDITPESLLFIHENNKRGICLYVDELTTWFRNFNRYSKGSEEQLWLTLFNGKSIVLDRKGNKNSLTVNKSFVGVIGTIQKNLLKDLAKGDRSKNGFLDRILYVIPKNLKKEYWSDKQLPLSIETSWRTFIESLIDKSYIQDENGDITSHELSFNTDAKQLLYEWQRVNTDMCNTEKNESLISVYSKLEIYVVRFCLILQIMRSHSGEATAKAIDTKSVEGAIAIVEYFRKTAMEVQQFVAVSIVETLSEQQLCVYDALPDNFTTAEGVTIATQNNMPIRTFQEFLSQNKGKLFIHKSHGVYSKKTLA